MAPENGAGSDMTAELFLGHGHVGGEERRLV